MKQLAVILALAAASLPAQTLTQGDRDFALSSLHASRKLFLDSIAGLTAAQWNFKPAPDRWSIAQVAEHIVLTEDSLYDYTQKLLAKPAVAGRTSDRAADEALLKRMHDRSRKAQAAPEGQPKGSLPAPAAAASAFRQSRDRTLDFVRETQADLRAHAEGSGPNGTDAYQALLMLAGHTDRHVAQIDEVKADARYPK